MKKFDFPKMLECLIFHYGGSRELLKKPIENFRKNLHALSLYAVSAGKRVHCYPSRAPVELPRFTLQLELDG